MKSTDDADKAPLDRPSADQPRLKASFFAMVYAPRSSGRELCLADPVAQPVQFAQLRFQISCCFRDGRKARVSDDGSAPLESTH
jgi:hypothetical protein